MYPETRGAIVTESARRYASSVEIMNRPCKNQLIPNTSAMTRSNPPPIMRPRRTLGLSGLRLGAVAAAGADCSASGGDGSLLIEGAPGKCLPDGINMFADWKVFCQAYETW